MTESAENELTPEEKLLKVIRDGNDNEVAPDNEVASTGTVKESAISAKTVIAENTVTAESVIAKTAKSDVATKDNGPNINNTDDISDTTVKDDLSEVGVATNYEVDMQLKGKRAPIISISFINKILAIIVVVMILFAFYEIWNNIQCSKDNINCDNSVIAAGLVDQEPEDKLPPLDDVIAKFSESKLIGRPEEVKQEPTQPVVKVTPLEVYVRKNLNLIGLSKGDDGTEAIINDIKNDKMYYLTIGSTLTINNTEVKVLDITSEYIELTDGKKKIQIK